MLGPVFHLDGDLLVPTELARGPWDPNAQHGGPVAASLARAVERCEPMPGLEVVRMIVEIIRPIPLSPLRTEAKVGRGGKRVQLVEASLFDGDVELARASAWRMRVADGLTPSIEPGTPPAPPEDGRLWESWSDIPGFWSAVEWRFVVGYFSDIGPATGWCRLLTPLFDGEEPTALQRVLVAADFGNGISGTLDFMSYLYINVDLALHLHRVARGDWIALEATTSVGSGGVGVARGNLYDESGSIGGSAQQLLVEPRRPD